MSMEVVPAVVWQLVSLGGAIRYNGAWDTREEAERFRERLAHPNHFVSEGVVVYELRRPA